MSETAYPTHEDTIRNRGFKSGYEAGMVEAISYIERFIKAHAMAENTMDMYARVRLTQLHVELTNKLNAGDYGPWTPMLADLP